jgi:L-malate glycosyltransferase
MPAGRLRVLVVAPSADWLGGQSTQAHLLLRGLADEPSVEMSFQPINPRLPGMLRVLQNMKLVRTVVTFPVYCAQLFLAIRRCDVVHIFSASYFSFVLSPTPAIYFARWLRKHSILNYHSGEAEDHLRRWPSAIRTLRLADRIVVPSGYLVRIFRSFGLEAQSVVNCADVTTFRFRSRTQPAAKFLANRNLEPHYNVACVLRAFALIQRELPEASLTVAGDGSLREALQGLADELSLENVRFLGRTSPAQMSDLYATHDVWLNASDVDNMPMSILEAFASGTTVVTTDAGGIPDMVSDNVNALVVKRGDFAALAECAVKLIREPSLFVRLTTSARAECSRYDWDTVRRQWLHLYFQRDSSVSLDPSLSDHAP